MVNPAPPPNAPYVPSLPITTGLEYPDGRIVATKGLCYGLICRSMSVGKSFGASFKALGGGEITQYTELMEDSRRHATDRMVSHAQMLGANAIICMRFDASEIGAGFTEIVAYGTAVVVERLGPPPPGTPG